jgi:hypothetical protein
LDNDDDDDGENLTVESGDGTLLFMVTSDGDLYQPAEADGLVKAAAYVWCGESAHVIRAFNTVGPSVTISQPFAFPGVCVVDFGFDVSERFYSAGSHPHSGPGGARLANCEPDGDDIERLSCSLATNGGDAVNGPLYVLVY